MAARAGEGRVSILPSGEDGGPPSRPLSATLERLGAHTPAKSRYELVGELARGGMGIIQRVWDGDLGRTIARKILGREIPGSDSRRSDPRTVGRFLEEAQITAQLEHPGIVPVHELGLDEHGVLYFTMRLVRGEDLHRIFEKVVSGEDGWNVTRALGVLLKASEALAFAHRKGVVHRDLKPANVMVGRFGEVYVMDWGLAHVLDQADTKDVRLQADPTSSSVFHTDRRREPETPDSPLLTCDGDVVGTPAYMSPEQARGELEHIGPRTDVYALGAMLYHLLSGRVPYLEPGRRLPPQGVLQRVLAGPPESLSSLAPATPLELLAICDKAMARELEQRYRDVQELADDLRAYLELRVVRAYRTGALVELRKWVRRNRLSAASIAALVVVMTGAGFALAGIENRRHQEEERRLAGSAVKSLMATIDELWPLSPEREPAMRSWLEQARLWISRLPEARADRDAFERAHASAPRVLDPPTPESQADEFAIRSLATRRDALAGWLRFLLSGDTEGVDPKNIENERTFAAANLDVLEREVPRLEGELEHKRNAGQRRPWHYSDAKIEGEYEERYGMVRALEDLAAPRGGIATVQERLDLVSTLRKHSIGDEQEAWIAAAASISDRLQSPLYEGLRLVPQLGLVPLDQDPDSGLWEFWHVLSGERPERGADGRWAITPDTGIILVLVPGGTFTMGSQDFDPDGPNYFDKETGIDEGLRAVDEWMAEVPVDAFFLAKYELTQGQWLRMARTQPSNWFAGFSPMGMARISLVHPVESLTWFDAEETLWRHGLDLPTEAQWERAARAGTQMKYGTGRTADSVVPLSNFADRRWNGVRPGEGDGRFDDGWLIHAPVDAYPPSAWGFHSIFGNVAEWCFDWYGSSCERGSFEAGSGEHHPKTSTEKAYRGGSFSMRLNELWASSRHGMAPSSGQYDLGVRAARRLDPGSGE